MKTGRNTLTKRLVAILLSILMVMQMMPLSGFALADGENKDWADGAKARNTGITYYTVVFVDDEGVIDDNYSQLVQAGQNAQAPAWYNGTENLNVSQDLVIYQDVTSSAQYITWSA